MESEEKFKTLFNSSSVVMTVSNLEDGRFIEVNDAFVQSTGLSREDVIGHTSAELSLYRRPEDRVRMIDEVRKMGSIRNMEIEFRIKSGEVRSVLFSAASLPLHGNMVLITSSVDITERKRIEEKLASQASILDTIIENTAAKLVYLDSDFNIILANKSYIDDSGHTWEELQGKNHFDYFPNTENESIFRMVRDTRKAVFFHDKPFEYADQPWRGTTYWDWTLVPIKEAFGKANGLVLSLIETTERKKAEQIKDDFIGMVSHELKTPLTVLIGALRVITNPGISKEEAQELIYDAQASADSLHLIIENLLELSRSQTNRLILECRQTNIQKIVNDVIDDLNKKSAKHQLIVDLSHDIPPVSVDPLRIERIIYNLVDNAIKYSPQGGKIEVFGYVENFVITIGVRDYGMGISADDQPQLFDGFKRFNTYKSNNIPGLGLGLKVCKILVQAHSGKIWVESEPRKGSTFYFTIPTNAVDSG